MCEEKLYANPIDSAILYRTLNILEKDGSINAYWDTEEKGKPKKWYKLTKLGREHLDEFYENILSRQRNFNYFIDEYKQIEEDEH